jgi:diguanylate cyclase (GGDEF)-like protein/PAS domain S-box-containing protein
MSLRNIVANLEGMKRNSSTLDSVLVNQMLARQSGWVPQRVEFRVTDVDGWARYGPGVTYNKPISLAFREYFTVHRSSEQELLIITSPVFGKIQKEWLISFSRRYKDAQGKFAGVVVSAVSLSAFQNLLDDIDVGKYGVAVLRDAQGGLIARNPKTDKPTGQIGSKIFSKELRDAIEQKLGTTDFHTYESSGDTERIVAYRRLDSGPFHLVVGSGTKDYLAPWYRDVAKAAVFEVCFVLATSLAAWLFWRLFNTTDQARRRSDLLLHNAHDGIHILSAEGLLIDANETFLRMLGYGREIIGKFRVQDWDNKNLKVVPPKNDQLTKRRIIKTEHRRSDGSVFPVEVDVSEIKLDGQIIVYAAARDITERQALEYEQRIAAIAFESQEGMLVLDSEGIVLRVNTAFTHLSGFESHEVVGKAAASLYSGAEQEGALLRMRSSVRLQNYWQGEIENQHKSGREVLQWVTVTAVHRADGLVGNYVVTVTDITERRSAEEEIKQLAFYDPLTRLPNRTHFVDRLRQAISAATRLGRVGGILFIDLDNFKSLNDAHGHDLGDQLLKLVAERLNQAVRQHDVVARFGGDEFVVLLPDLSLDSVTAAAMVEQVGQKVLEIIGKPYELGNHNHHYTASIGAALYDGNTFQVEELLKRADMAMYEAKSVGRNQLRFFDPEMQAQVNARVAMEADMRKALAQGEFVLHYQPQMDQLGSIVGTEALVRWQHPEKGMIPPGNFISFAESSGLIVPLGKIILEMACSQLAQWSRLPGFATIRMSVNISAKQLHHPDFVSDVVALLEKYTVPPDQLELELTESLFVASVDAIIEKMHALQRLGIRFSLDDFGTGYSSLAYLKRMPINQLKIDQGFVRDIMVDPNDATITVTIIELARSLGIEVIAEGVETEDQLNFLTRNKCARFQGYFFSRPLPAIDFERYVAQCIPSSAGQI